MSYEHSETVKHAGVTRQVSQNGLKEFPWRLPAPMFSVFSRRGNWADLITMNRIALESARQAGNRQGEAWVLNTLGQALGVIRDSESIGCLERSLAIRREIGDRRGETQSANSVADAYEALGRRKEAVDLLRRALELNRKVGDRYGEAVALSNLGAALLHLGRPAEAIDFLQQSPIPFPQIRYLVRARSPRPRPGRVCHSRAPPPDP